MDYKKRRQNLLTLVPDRSIIFVHSGDLMKKTADQFYPFLTNRNFLYLTGINEENAVLCIIKGIHGASLEILFKEQTDPVRKLWDGAKIDFSVAKDISKVDEVRNVKTIEQYLKLITSSQRSAVFGQLKNLYLDFESDYTTSPSYRFYEFIKKEIPYLSVENIHSQIAQLRMIKDEKEIECLKKAVDITAKGLENIRKHLRSGVYEFDMEAEYNYILKKNNVITSFDTIAGSGKNSTTLHYVKNEDLIPANSLCVFDLGVYYEGYASDITRTYPVEGKFTERQKTIYNIVLKAQQKAMSILKPGVTWQEYNKAARDVLIEEAKKIGLIKTDDEINKYYYHSVGHFLGLDVHDVGDYSKPMEKGMYITTEPGLYIAEEEIGVRIEDDVLITENGYICLSDNIPRTVEEIEAQFQKIKEEKNNK